VLSAGVTVEEGAQVVDSVIMPFARIKKNAVVRRSIVAENAVIGQNARVGEGTGGIAVVGTNIQLPEGAVLPAGEQAGN
jgi:glucose-1-phosphate adenylyltransferase